MTTSNKSDNSKEIYGVEQKEICYKTDECKFDNCVEPVVTNDILQETGT